MMPSGEKRPLLNLVRRQGEAMNDLPGAVVTDKIRAMIGKEGKPVTSCDEVSSGDIRRFVQAIMDESRIYYDTSHASQTKYGGIVCPGSFPITFVRRRTPGTPDPIVASTTEEAKSGERDWLQVPWPSHMQQFHAYSELFIYRFAQPGDRITERTQITDIYEKQGRSGRLGFIVTDKTFVNQDGAVLCVERYCDLVRE